MEVKDLKELPFFIQLRFAMAAERWMKKFTPVDTGRLRSSIHHALVDKNTIMVGSNVEYAPYILPDTKPYFIRAKNAKALRFIAPATQRVSSSYRKRTLLYRTESGKLTTKKSKAAYIFRKKVRHPGGANVLGRAADQVESRAEQIIRNAVKEFVR